MFLSPLFSQIGMRAPPLLSADDGALRPLAQGRALARGLTVSFPLRPAASLRSISAAAGGPDVASAFAMLESPADELSIAGRASRSVSFQRPLQARNLAALISRPVFAKCPCIAVLRRKKRVAAHVLSRQSCGVVVLPIQGHSFKLAAPTLSRVRA